MKKKLRVLVCLGGYNPEIAGGAIQQENIINNLKNKINFNSKIDFQINCLFFCYKK